MLKSQRFWIGLIVSLFFLALFFYGANFGSMWQAMQRANYIFIAPALTAYFIGVWFRAYRWRILLRPIRTFSPSRLFPFLMIGYMANNLLPARLGELVRSYVVGEREGLSKTSVLGTIIIERIFDGLALLFFVLVASFFIAFTPWIRNSFLMLGLLFGFVFLFLLFVGTSEARTRKLTSLLLGVLPQRGQERLVSLLHRFHLTDMALRFLDGFRSLQSPRRTLAVFVLSVLAWSMESIFFYFMSFSFDLGQPVYVFFLASAAANLITTLPSSQGGIGPFEWASMQILVFFGVEPSLAQAYSIAMHATVLIPPTILGLLFLWLENLSWAEVTKQGTPEALARRAAQPSLERQSKS